MNGSPDRPSDVMVWAERYAELGWHVFPVHSNRGDGRCTCGNADCDRPGKHPRTKHGLKDATADPDRIRRWSELWRNSNIGVATGGGSGIFVIDIDNERAFDALVERHGPLPATAEQQTGRGRQLVFRYPADCTIRNKTELGGRPGVDVRGDGGYVVVPPSRHVNGKTYAWQWSSDPTDGAALAELPATWLELLTAPSQSAPSDPEEHNSVLREGQRNDQLFKQACSMRGKGMSGEAIEAALLVDNKVRCRTPLSDPEVRKIAASAVRYKPSAPPIAGPKTKQVQPWRPFPTALLPEPLRTFVEQGARSLVCDAVLVALPALAVLAAAIGFTRKISLKRGRTGWSEPAVVWSCPISESGTQKTPAFNMVVGTVLELQRAALKDYQHELAVYEKALEQHEKVRAQWRKCKGDEDGPPEPPARPTAKRYMISDTTVEAAAPILEENPRGTLLARDELAGWFASFDRYAGGKGKVQGDAAQWESMFNAGPIIVDRKTGDRRTIFVPHAAVSICGGIQPQTLRRALGQAHFESGLAQRCLFAMPPRLPKRWSDAEIPEDVETAFASVIRALYGLNMSPPEVEGGDPQPVLVPLMNEAQRLWVQFVNEHGRRQLDTTGDLAAAFSKLEAYAARFALIFHFVRWATDDPTLEDVGAVDCTSIRSGIELSGWFCYETERVYAILRETDDDRRQRELIEWIERRSGSVTPRELQAGRREFRGSSESARDALQALVNQGHGVWVTSGPGPEGGHPSEVFRLFPRDSDTPDSDPANGGSVDADSDGAGRVGPPERELGPSPEDGMPEENES